MPSSHTDLLWTAIWLIAAALAGAAAIFAARSWRKRYQASDLEQPFTLQDLRAMRDRGDISPPEFETMKAALVGRARATGAAPEPIPPVSGRSDATPAGAAGALWPGDDGSAGGRRPPTDDDPHGAAETGGASDGTADGGDGGSGD